MRLPLLPAAALCALTGCVHTVRERYVPAPAPVTYATPTPQPVAPPPQQYGGVQYVPSNPNFRPPPGQPNGYYPNQGPPPGQPNGYYPNQGPPPGQPNGYYPNQGP
ncbi:MAG: hypothetical protein FJ086_16650, partial [Deltaproteobacteria bacterium]|nr:hypothetical protein [Deltaproteobacteria bacterium]